MRGKPVDAKTKQDIFEYRRKGYSINEISVSVGRSKSVISRYIQGIEVGEPFSSILRSKQGASRTRSEKEWNEAKSIAKNILGDINQRDLLILLAGVYWGEGTKAEANIINGDPKLLKIFIEGLTILGVKKEEFKISIRLFGKMNTNLERKKIVRYWLKELQLPDLAIRGFEVVPGNNQGKLPYGMCRIRITKGGRYFKIVMSLIEEIKSQICSCSSMDRIAHS